ncbi:MAG TPA: pyridoxal-phosphate dependent enzyme [Rhodanobacteraceae bacterium]|nr:pyridoxal-phosphate dependent enzyme [Rhodanobacteraceae bacterium]
MNHFTAPTLVDIRAAAARIASHAIVTPVLTAPALDEQTGAKMFFKCEHLQRGGAFKFRGACNAVWTLSEAEAARGVVTHSSGNHGAALALAAATRGIPAHIVVPEGAVAAKLANIERAGGILHPCAPTLAAREETCAKVQRETGATLVHPFADARVVAGQGTAALELLQQAPDLDAVVVPVGGGGLVSGCAIVLRALAPSVDVVGAEPAGADDAFRSLERGRRVTDVVPETICDGLRATIGEPNFAMLREHHIEVIPIDDDATLAAMRLLWMELKQTVEPSSATVLAALLSRRARFAGRRVGLVLSGGNVDLNAISFLADVEPQSHPK